MSLVKTSRKSETDNGEFTLAFNSSTKCWLSGPLKKTEHSSSPELRKDSKVNKSTKGNSFLQESKHSTSNESHMMHSEPLVVATENNNYQYDECNNVKKNRSFIEKDECVYNIKNLMCFEDGNDVINLASDDTVPVKRKRIRIKKRKVKVLSEAEIKTITADCLNEKKVAIVKLHQLNPKMFKDYRTHRQYLKMLRKSFFKIKLRQQIKKKKSSPAKVGISPINNGIIPTIVIDSDSETESNAPDTSIKVFNCSIPDQSDNAISVCSSDITDISDLDVSRNTMWKCSINEQLVKDFLDRSEGAKVLISRSDQIPKVVTCNIKQNLNMPKSDDVISVCDSDPGICELDMPGNVPWKSSLDAQILKDFLERSKTARVLVERRDLAADLEKGVIEI